MAQITVVTPGGIKMEYIHASGITYDKAVLELIPNGDLQAHINDVRDLEIRDDDIYLAAYQKCGTHWVWEMLVMLRRGKAEYETKTKEAAFLDLQSPDVVKDIPSPRVLNCHYPCKLAPKGLFEKEIKIVHVMRNPKDAFVSLYYHYKHFAKESKIQTFQDYLPQMLGEYGIHYFYPWFTYVKEWERFSKQHPEQILNIFYEDIKENPIKEIQKIDTFLGTGRPKELISQIAEACDFHNLKKADAEVKLKENFMKDDGRPSPMYRKGQVGDWKNHFTVAQNDKMNKWLEDNLIDTELKFRYTL